MLIFWILSLLSIAAVACVMVFVSMKAREVPGESERRVRHRLNPDHLRLLAYAVVILVCLLAAMYELSVMYGG